jgi:hypothetical protein
LAGYQELPLDEMQARARAFRELLSRRRTVRDYAARAVPRELIEDCLRAAGSAPSGANLQPWHFAAVSDPAIKRQIRIAAEAEEHEFYARRAPDDWLAALAPLGTGPEKPFLEVAPWLIAIFEQRWGYGAGGEKIKHYYPEGIRRYRDRAADHGTASCRAGDPDPHAQPHEIPQSNSRAPAGGTSLPAARDRLSRAGGEGAGHQSQESSRVHQLSRSAGTPPRSRSLTGEQPRHGTIDRLAR